MAAVEYKAKDGSTEILPIFPTSEIQTVRFMLGNSTVELHNNLLSNGARTLDVLIRQNPGPSTNVVPPTVVDHRSSSSIVREPALVAGSPKQLDNVIDPEVAKKEAANKEFNEMKERRRKYKEEYRSVLLVLVSVYIAMTYQTGMAPPRGLWQDDSNDPSSSPSSNNTSIPSSNTTIPSNNTNILSNNTSTLSNETYTNPHHTAGDSIFQDKDNTRFFWFYHANSMAFSSSLITIVILLSETYASSDWLAVETVKFLILIATVFIGIAFTLGSAYQYGAHENLVAIGFICLYIPFLIFDFVYQKIRYKKMQQACE